MRVYALATVATGVLDIVWGRFEPGHQPIQALGQLISGQQAFAYLAGVCLTLTGAAMLWRRFEWLGMAGSALIYLVFALLWLARFLAITHQLGFRLNLFIFCLGGFAAQTLFMAPAAFVYLATAPSDPARKEWASTIGRWLFGLAPIAFGLGHMINLPAYIGIVPHWVPFGSFWVVLTGVAFLLAGGAILSGVKDVIAAQLLALMLLLFEITVEAPPVFRQAHRQEVWGGAVYNLAAVGAYLIFAELAKTRTRATRDT